MKFLNYSFLFLLGFLGLFGCNSNDGSGSTPAPVKSESATNDVGVLVESSEEEVVNEVAEEATEEVEAVVVGAIDSKGVKFSIREGYCQNKAGKKVLIESEKLMNCSDFSNRNLEEIDLKAKKFKHYGASLLGSDLSRNKVNYWRIVWYENLLDQTTLFPAKNNNLKKKLGNNHHKATKVVTKGNKKKLAKVKTLIKKNRLLKEEYLKEETKKSRKKKIVRLMKKNKKTITKLETQVNDYNKKSSRHKKESKLYLSSLD